MTKEEAIIYLKRADMTVGQEIKTKTAEALEMAIEALKNIQSHETVTEFADRCRECGSKYGKLLKQEQETGHWIVHDHGYGVKYYQCSNCKGFDGGEKGKYCKWCGKKMIELQKGTVSE